MTMKKLSVLASFACFVLISASCSAGADDGDDIGTDPKGIGRFKDVKLANQLDDKLVAAGETVYNVKCASCHKLTDEKLVGPGWQGVTSRRAPEWIMNFITNTDEMIDKDTGAQNMFEEYRVRMPNQSLSDNDARATLEFMRKIDAKQ